MYKEASLIVGGANPYSNSVRELLSTEKQPIKQFLPGGIILSIISELLAGILLQSIFHQIRFDRIVLQST